MRAAPCRAAARDAKAMVGGVMCEDGGVLIVGVVVLAVLCAALATALVLMRRRGRANGGEDGGRDGDLSADAIAILASLDACVIVVDDSDDVVHAAPDAYRLSLVNNDAICDERLRERVIAVRGDGRMRRFDLTTRTAGEYVFTEETARAMERASSTVFSTRSAAQAIAEASGGAGEGDGVFNVTSRLNYLTVTAARINERLTLITAQDVSEEKRFERLRDDFTSHVSDRLQAPADHIEALAASIADPDSTADDMRGKARQVEDEARYLRHLVADLIVLLHAQEPVEPTSDNRLDMGVLVKDVVESERAAAAEYGVSIVARTPSVPVFVHGDVAQLETAVRKLVENAVEFTPSGKQVSVIVSVADDGGTAQIRVIDHGPGIARADQGRVFTRFWRGDPAARLHGGQDGTGLGLAIVKHVALTHHGTVTVWSKPGEGSTFTLILPLCSEKA